VNEYRVVREGAVVLYNEVGADEPDAAFADGS
jgi:hypothetical protein